MVVRWLMLLLGLSHIANGLWMLVDPHSWSASVLALPEPSALNLHVMADVGMAYLASGAGMALAARKGSIAAALGVAGATWPALHGLIHIDGWLMHGIPASTHDALSEGVGVILLAALGVAAAWMRARMKGDS